MFRTSAALFCLLLILSTERFVDIINCQESGLGPLSLAHTKVMSNKFSATFPPNWPIRSFPTAFFSYLLRALKFPQNNFSFKGNNFERRKSFDLRKFLGLVLRLRGLEWFKVQNDGAARDLDKNEVFTRRFILQLALKTILVNWHRGEEAKIDKQADEVGWGHAEVMFRLNFIQTSKILLKMLQNINNYSNC